MLAAILTTLVVLRAARYVAAPPSPTWCLQDGWSALMWAGYKGHTAVVQILLDKGASIDLQNKVGQKLMVFSHVGS